MKKINIIVLLFLSVFVVSCASVNPPVNNIIEIDKKGDPNLPGDNKRLTKQEYADHIKNVLEFKEKKKIIIYIHGGLNYIRTSEKRAKFLSKELDKDGYHPIFIHWRSGLGSSYIEHLFFQRQGEHWNIFGPLSSPFVLLTDIGRGVFRTPMIWVYQTASYVKALGLTFSDNVGSALDNSEMLKKTGTIDYKDGIDLRPKKLKTPQGIVGLGQLGLSFVTAPVFDAIGTGAWDVMKRRTDALFTKAHSDSHKNIEEYCELKKGALTTFFDKLKEKVVDSNGRPKDEYEIILVGHSMGTIVANQILQRWPEISYNKIIYMAAACNIKNFELSVVPYLKKNKSTHFFNYVLHRKAENYESHIYGLGGVGSLLVQIDNFYANPVSEKERTLGKWENVMNGLNYFDKDIYGQLHIRTMDYDLKLLEWTWVEDHKGYPIKHGQFGTAYGFWKEDLSKQMRLEEEPEK